MSVTDLQTNQFKIIDISPPISPSTPVFPGDTNFSLTEQMSFKQGHHLTLCSLNSTTHIGAHADAPIHYHQEGVTIEKRDLSFYMGPVTIIDLSEMEDSLIRQKHYQSHKIQTSKVLFKTKSFPHAGPWTDDFVAIHPQTINDLHQQGVTTVGIDTPSVDPASSKNLQTHQNIYDCQMAILEGLNLDYVQAGEYFLSALPLNIEQGDASPVRAVLLQFE